MDRGKEARASRSKRGQKEDEMRLRREAAEVLDLQRNGDLDMALDRAMSLFNASPFPDCIETTTAHGESLSASKEYSLAESQFNRALSIARPLDPAIHNISYGVSLPEKASKSQRITAARERLQRAIDINNNACCEVDVERVLSIAKSSGVAYAVHRAAAVATTFPKSARANFCQPMWHWTLPRLRMSVVEPIEKADDPSSHDIPVGSTKGDEYDDRICFVKKQIHGLLQTLVLFARRDWSLITSEKQRMILSVRLDVLCEYYSKINRSLSKSLTDAHHFEVADAAELQREKRKEGNDIIKAVKKKLRNLPSDRSSNEFHVACKIIQEMCHKLLKSSCTDYREFVLPLLRFHRWLSYSDNLIAGEDKRSEVLVENANPSDLELIDVEDNGVKPSATLETKGTSNYQNSVQDVPKILVPKISDPSLYKPPPDPRIVNQQATRYGYSALHRPAIGQSVVTPVNRLVEIVDAANKFDPYEVEHSHQSYRREQAKIPKDQELCVICFFERYSTIAMASGKNAGTKCNLCNARFLKDSDLEFHRRYYHQQQ
uniref:C2H2-type domain-containing protein n=1 Tax=Oryza rufipogon TaxID=4529 RepID=A0A0E0RA28_ORYRU